MTQLGTGILSGFDLSFDIGSRFTGDYLQEGQTISIYSPDIKARDWDEEAIYIDISRAASNVITVLFRSEVGIIDESRFPLPSDETFDSVSTVYPYPVVGIRVVWHHEFVSIMINGTWWHTFYPFYVDYERDIPRVFIVSNMVTRLVNVRLKEIPDWREAIYVDLESSALSGLSSVIQQRPVEMREKQLGVLSFQMETAVRDEILTSNFNNATAVQATYSDIQVPSEALVYFTNVGAAVNTDILQKYGFITRVFRLPDLDSGAMRATQAIQTKGLEAATQITASGTFDPHLEIGDVLYIKHGIPSSTFFRYHEMILEKVRYSFSVSVASMSIQGRARSASITGV